MSKIIMKMMKKMKMKMKKKRKKKKKRSYKEVGHKSEVDHQRVYINFAKQNENYI
jgi:hypothetical protein